MLLTKSLTLCLFSSFLIEETIFCNASMFEASLFNSLSSPIRNTSFAFGIQRLSISSIVSFLPRYIVIFFSYFFSIIVLIVRRISFASPELINRILQLPLYFWINCSIIVVDSSPNPIITK